MVTADIADNNLIKILEGFTIFERNKVSLEIKLIAIAINSFFQRQKDSFAL